MGRGNVCVRGKYEGLYYIDKEYIEVYCKQDPENEDICLAKTQADLSSEELLSGDWLYDESASEDAKDQVLEGLMYALQDQFPSFERFTPETWKDGRQLLLENRLFVVAVEDNEWSLAVELLQKEDDTVNLQGLQSRQYQRYLDGMRDALLEHLPSIRIYAGPCTSGTIMRKNCKMSFDVEMVNT